MSNRITITADNKIPYLKGALESFAEMSYRSPREIVKENIRTADALIVRTRTECNEALLEGTNVRFIATATIGFDHIDVSYCEKHKIKWMNAPGCNSSSVMQYIGSALLTLAKEKSFQLTDRTIGIVGVGNVGRKVGRLAKLFGMKVLYNDPPRMRVESHLDFVPLQEIIEHCDIITFHVPLTKTGIDKTYHIANEAFFSRLKRETIIINTSRGAVVDSTALKSAIQSGVISASVLDVWEHEPDIDRELLGMVTIATPHIAGYSADGKANGTAVCVHAVNDFFGLGAQASWRPEVPLPSHPMNLDVDCARMSFQEALCSAIIPTYEIRSDDALLRRSPETFERQRSEYPVRREYPHYELRLNNPGSEMIFVLQNLGFKIKKQ